MPASPAKALRKTGKKKESPSPKKVSQGMRRVTGEVSQKKVGHRTESASEAGKIKFVRRTSPQGASSTPKKTPIAKSLKTLRTKLALSMDTFAQVLQVTPRTISRWEKADTVPSNPADIAHIKKLEEIVAFGLMVYSLEGLQSLFTEAQPEFGGKTGIAMLTFGEYESVMSAIAADYEGLGY